LGLETADAVRASATAIEARLARHHPGLEANGFSVQAMVFRPHARRLMAGIACDRLFGPVVVFGEGGRHNGLIHDRTIGLPPINLPLARGMIARTRVSGRLEADSTRPAVDRDAVAELLVRLSRILVDNPEIVACDIDPLLADEDGVLALDARMRVEPFSVSDRRSFAILPYPAELEEPAALADGSPILLRPIRPEDEPAHAELIHKMSPQDLRMRFFGLVREVAHYQLARMTQIDYDREMAFVAERRQEGGGVETLGVVRTISDPDHVGAELAILVRSDLKGTGLGRILMDKMIRYHQRKGTGSLTVQVLAENAPMLRLARRFGYQPVPSEEPQMLELRLDLAVG
jgi:acetyltransferase